MNDLNEIDFLLLDFIEKNEPVKIDDIKKRFKRFNGIEALLKDLRHKKYICQPQYTEKSFPYTEIRLKPICSLTESGKIAIQNHKTQIKKQRKETLLKNVWLPVTVSFVTTLLTNYLMPMLSQMLQWLANTLSKIV